jgi:uncharacterized protein
MLRDSIVVDRADSEHVRFRDGLTFHVRSGDVAQDAGDCRCATSEAVFDVGPYREAVPQLQLSLTDACNMSCTYCSFRERVHADGKPVTIPLETVKKAVDFYRREVLGGEARYSRVDFGLAGETMLVRNMHEDVHRIIEDGLQNAPVGIVWSGPNVTNGTLSMASELSAQLGPPQDISLDGPREVHDRVRSYTGRGGTYDDVRSVLDEVLQQHPDMGVSAVLTAYCTDIARIFSHLYDEVGARNIYMKPVNAPHELEYALNQHTLPAFKAGYLGLVEHILGRPPREILDRLLALNPEDFFMRFIYRVKDRAVQTYRCGAGKSGAYVDTNGRLYACAHFMGKSGWHIGHVDTGFDEDRRLQFASLTVDTREPCRSCFARYVCGGGCYYQAVLANGDISRPDDVKCELIRFLSRLAIRLVAKLRSEYPEVLAALPTPFGLDSTLADASVESVYQPIGRFQRAIAPIGVALHPPGKIRYGLPPQRDLRVECSMRGRQLIVELAGSMLPAKGALGEVSAVRIWLQPFGDRRFTLADVPIRTSWNSGKLLRVTSSGAAWLVTPTSWYRRVPHQEARWRPAPDIRVERTPRAWRIVVDLNTDETWGPALGLNVFADLVGGAEAALLRYEPFASLPLDVDGPLELVGPDATENFSHDVRWPDELVPLGRWAGLRANVC